MYRIPTITPVDNIIKSIEVLRYISTHRLNYYSIDKRYPYGEPDYFTNFFISRRIRLTDTPIIQYEFDHPNYNAESLKDYINYCINNEVKLIDYIINKLELYYYEAWPIASPYTNLEPDFFLIFFAERELPIQSFSAEKHWKIGASNNPYMDNTRILYYYKRKIEMFLTLDCLYKNYYT